MWVTESIRASSYSQIMAKKVLTITEFARMGGIARSKSLTRDERVKAAKKAINARWARYGAKKQK